jgi:hypothetical protein
MFSHWREMYQWDICTCSCTSQPMHIYNHLNTIRPLLHIDFYSLNMTWFRAYWALWRRWSDQICTKKSNSEVHHQGHAGPPTHRFLQPSYDLLSRLLSTPKKMVGPDFRKKIRLQSWPPRWWSPPHTSIFTAFIWLAFEVIEHSEEDGPTRFAWKKHILKFTTKAMLVPHTSMFTAFMWLPWHDVGLDFEVIEHSEEDGLVRFARKNQVPKLTTPVMLPPP